MIVEWREEPSAAAPDHPRIDGAPSGTPNSGETVDRRAEPLPVPIAADEEGDDGLSAVPDGRSRERLDGAETGDVDPVRSEDDEHPGEVRLELVRDARRDRCERADAAGAVAPALGELRDDARRSRVPRA